MKERTAEEKVKLVWPLAGMAERGNHKGIWTDPDPMADYLGESWEEVATYDRVVAAAHVVATFENAPCVLPPWASSPEVNKMRSEEAERIAAGDSYEPLATTAYTLGRGHTCAKCENSNTPCEPAQPNKQED